MLSSMILWAALAAPAHAGDCTVAGQPLGDWVEGLWVPMSNVKATRSQVAAAGWGAARGAAVG